MSIPHKTTYPAPVIEELSCQWPENRTVNIVCHGHSVPAGYFAEGVVNTFESYPHLFHRLLKDRFPFAVVNVIVSAIGGEESPRGAARFERDVLTHAPSVVTIDYGLNDRRVGLAEADRAWRFMIEASLQRGIKLILMTPTADATYRDPETRDQWEDLQRRARQIRELAAEHEVALVDSLALFEDYGRSGGQITDLLSTYNHPNRKGHELVAAELATWFPVT